MSEFSTSNPALQETIMSAFQVGIKRRWTGTQIWNKIYNTGKDKYIGKKTLNILLLIRNSSFFPVLCKRQMSKNNYKLFKKR